MEKIYTVREVAQLLQVKRERVSQWLDQGQLKGHKLSERSARVRESDLDQFLREMPYSSRQGAP